MVRRSWGRVGWAMGLAVAMAACGDEGATPAGEVAAVDTVESRRIDPALAARLPPDASFASAEQGQALFATCATCHGFEGEGTQLGPSLRDTVSLHGATEIPRIDELIRTGVPEPIEFPVPMPPHGGGRFDDAQIRALATYVFLLGSQE